MTEETLTHPLTAIPEKGFSTRCVHAGAARSKPYHALIEPIVQTSTFMFDDTDDVIAYQEARKKGTGTRIEYGRYGNPTVEAAERRVAELEHADGAIMFSSGMAAVTTALLTLLPGGSHLVMTDDCYRRTRQFCREFLGRLGVACTVVPMGDYAALEAAIRPETRLLVSETPTNPYLRVLDVEQFAEIARRRGVLSLVDATFATPVNQRPLDWGVDLVVHSGTKYLGGHNDLLAGFVAGSRDLLATLREGVNILGSVPDPQNAFLLVRGLKTLALRVGHQNRSGQLVAEFLERHPAVERVWYPGLASHPEHQVAARQMAGFGGVVSFNVKGDFDSTRFFLDALQIPYISPSLGGPESLVVQPALNTYYDLSAAQRREIGIEDNLVRLALGLEDPADLIADLDQALVRTVLCGQ
ncbi:MAG TPA: aminotransferase class I/II-fold pyridoxal phosphate-dependent enzyme [Anaerolineaceae bacterium]|nr:aminotransferase class I/II-fold pyridoxal phosphate-dependent enzyme [Anaerolineaceae bacterium]HPN51451.1 aminotransferase class I/II-fold pyridoxal phosphate-dependent enzyme [Anaerolineaceae bacterium]